ncbi:MAG: hypothetical protein DI616_15160 [Paracoccus denitrificans]|uniref:Lipoprotein n=1 Tax=Paracoccus denitrificans TaxID=266 RepID=A0A533I6E5_PARDE|nr:MAG: hypothetical protein DI616_15160 [Paracoccus denitrificans]
MFTRFILAAASVAALSACAITPQQYESTPVLAQSPVGPVTCQIYTHEQVTWDRSINRPASMSVTTADNLCRQEGARIMQGGAPNYAPTAAAPAN